MDRSTDRHTFGKSCILMFSCRIPQFIWGCGVVKPRTHGVVKPVVKHSPDRTGGIFRTRQGYPPQTGTGTGGNIPLGQDQRVFTSPQAEAVMQEVYLVSNDDTYLM